MSFQPTTKCRAYREGRVGRIHSYRCRQCGAKFSTDLRLTPLSEPEKICPQCKSNNHVAVMVANDVGNGDSFKK